MWLTPFPIGISSNDFSSRVSMNNTININHGNNLEDICVQQLLGLLAFT